MATEAQVQANRLNAQKSTGPRTTQGKEKASQNSLKHGLFAREGVIRGEDREEFEVHRETLMEQLNPAGPLEEILAARIVDFTWRLRRAAQDQNETFGALYDRYVTREGPAGDSGGDTGLCVAGVPPSDRGPEALATRGQDAHDTDTPHERGATVGRMILEDFAHEALLERLLRHERRVESSLYRTLNEFRRLHDQSRKANEEAVKSLQQWREEDWQARKARAFAFSPPPDGSAPGPLGETRSTPMAEVPHPSDTPSLQFTNPAPESASGDEMRETNPIRREAKMAISADRKESYKRNNG